MNPCKMVETQLRVRGEEVQTTHRPVAPRSGKLDETSVFEAISARQALLSARGFKPYAFNGDNGMRLVKGGQEFIAVWHPETASFFIPQKSYNLIDGINRAILASGKTGTALLAGDADYNGHRLNVWWNEYRQYYVCDYTWAGRVSVASGSLEQVLPIAVREFGRQGRGAELCVAARWEDKDRVRQIAPTLLPYNEATDTQLRAKWWDVRMDKIGDALYAEKQFGVPAVRFLVEALTIEEYETRVREYYDSRREEVLTHAQKASTAFEKSIAHI